MRFPRMHVAQSTVNRIINTAKLTMPRQQIVATPPVLPDTDKASNALNEQMKTPPTPAALPAGAEGAMVDAAIKGESPLEAATGQALQGSGLP